MICKQLGFSRFVSYGLGYGKGNGPIWLNNLTCTGQESSIAACNHNGWGVHSCSHNDDIGVTCYDSKKFLH